MMNFPILGDWFATAIVAGWTAIILAFIANEGEWYRIMDERKIIYAERDRLHAETARILNQRRGGRTHGEG